MIYSKGNGCKIVFRPLEESKKAAPKSGPFTGGMNCNKNRVFRKICGYNSSGIPRLMEMPHLRKSG
jgi:hypothetical protein